MEKEKYNYMEDIRIESGKVTISDPCYGNGTWCQAENVPIENGDYSTEIKIFGDVSWGERVESIAIYNKNYISTELDKDKIDWFQINAEIGVDSGQAGIFDTEYYNKYHTPDSESSDHVDEDWYNVVCDTTYSDERGGTMDNKGLVSSSGYGDGGYAAFCGKIDGKVIAIKVVFIDDEDKYGDEDYDDEY